ncbi:MAG: phosphopentomutase, partial [Cetobacterium sp.]
YKGSDHTREYIPVLVYGKNMKQDVNLEILEGFSTIAATVEEFLLGKTDLTGSFATKITK